jgi:hypothetical protein
MGGKSSKKARSVTMVVPGQTSLKMTPRKDKGWFSVTRDQKPLRFETELRSFSFWCLIPGISVVDIVSKNTADLDILHTLIYPRGDIFELGMKSLGISPKMSEKVIACTFFNLTNAEIWYGSTEIDSAWLTTNFASLRNKNFRGQIRFKLWGVYITPMILEAYLSVEELLFTDA